MIYHYHVAQWAYPKDAAEGKNIRGRRTAILFEYMFVQLFRKTLLALGCFMKALYLLPVYKTNQA